MPHCELKYSSDLEFDAHGLLMAVERCIQSHDAGSGECKGRAYPCDMFHHSHFLMNVGLLDKPHRNEVFMAALLVDLEALAKSHIKQNCQFSLGLEFSPTYYVTNSRARAEG